MKKLVKIHDRHLFFHSDPNNIDDHYEQVVGPAILERVEVLGPEIWKECFGGNDINYNRQNCYGRTQLFAQIFVRHICYKQQHLCFYSRSILMIFC